MAQHHGNETFGNMDKPPSPLLTEYLEANPSVNSEAVLELVHIPTLLGGFKSHQFVVEVPEDSFGNPLMTVSADLSKAIVPADGLRDFSDLMDSGEATAAERYPVALSITEYIINHRQASGVSTDIIFIPDVTNESAKEYHARLQRLAQDTGKTVVMRVRDEKYGDYDVWNRFEPPIAESVEVYWQAREPAYPIIRMGAYRRPEPPDSEVELIEAIHCFARNPRIPLYDATMSDAEYAVFQTARDTWVEHLAYIARGTPEQLTVLLSPARIDKAVLVSLQKYAYGQDQPGEKARKAARIITAKLDDQIGLQTLADEIQPDNPDYGWGLYWSETLGEYLRNDVTLRRGVMQYVEERFVGLEGNEATTPIIHMIGALRCSEEFDACRGISRLLDLPPNASQDCGWVTAYTVMKDLPELVDSLRAREPSAEQTETFKLVEQQVATFLDRLLKGELNDVMPVNSHQFAMCQASELLLKFGNPERQDLLRRQCLALFALSGSVITDSQFESHYPLYRKQYGDIPEISARIHKPRASND